MKEENVSFEDISDFKVDAPMLSENGTGIVVTSNLDIIAAKIRSVVDKYGSIQLTEDNVGYVKTVKSHFTSLRTGIDRERKEWTRMYLTPAKEAVNAMCDELQKMVAEGENALAEQLDAYDQKRKDELTEVLNMYRSDAVEKYGLREEYACQLVLKDKYYNKTQKEEDTADDIDLTAKELREKQDSYDSAVELINAECDGTTLLPGTYIRQLSYKSPIDLLKQIKEDKKDLQKRIDELNAKEKAGEKAVIGEPISAGIIESLSKQQTEKVEKGGMRTRKIIITYDAKVAQDIIDFFVEKGIQYKFVKE